MVMNVHIQLQYMVMGFMLALNKEEVKIGWPRQGKSRTCIGVEESLLPYA